MIRFERSLVATGLLGVVLGLVLFGCSAVFGARVGPEGNLVKAGVFALALGVFTLNVSLFLLVTGWGSVTRRWYRRLTVVAALISYGIETYKTARGLDPRFPTVATGAFERLLSTVFGLVALSFVVLFTVLTVRLLIHRTDLGPAVTASVRYACLGGMTAMGVGVWMSVQGGPRIGAGDLLPLHAAGFHALQAIPLVALVATWADVAGRVRLTHLAGVGWLTGCAGLAWHTGTGHAPLAPSPGAAVAVAGFLLWLVPLAVAVRAHLSPRVPGTPG